MKKQIRLLVEGLFKDLYDIEDQKNDDIDIADEYISYRIGDIYYDYKEPYAICCGTKKEFKDGTARFALIKQEMSRVKWCEENIYIEKLKKINCKTNQGNICSVNKLGHIDEKGYENTQIMKRNYDLKYFPIFKYCCQLGENVYVPAIDELSRMYLNLIKLNKESILTNLYYWSSSQFKELGAIALDIEYDDIYINVKSADISVKPFINIYA